MPKTTTKKTRKSSQKATSAKKVTTKPPLAPENGLQFIKAVFDKLWSSRKLFGSLLLLGWLTLMLATGTTESSTYADFSAASDQAVETVQGGAERFWTAVWILFSSLLAGSIGAELSETQSLYRGVVVLALWLVTVWLLRHLAAGTKVALRDGLYQGMAPLVPTVLLVLFAAVQLLPLALSVSLIATLLGTGALQSVWFFVLIAIIILALSVGTLYWLTTTFIATIIASIPGTYPVAAYRSAQQVISGRRLYVLKRLLWLIVFTLGAYVLVMLPPVMLDAASGAVPALLIVAVSYAFAVAAIIYASSYIYLLYRRIIDERAV